MLRENLSQQFLVISGPAGVGKSVLVSIIERILGLENITEFQPSRLSNPFEMVEYSNKHLLTAKGKYYKYLKKSTFCISLPFKFK